MGQGVDDRVLHGRRGADRAGLADALGPELVDGVGRLHRHQLEAGQLGGRDHGVVGQVRGDRVAVGVVAHLLEEGLGRSLGQAAVTLALGEQRVEDGAGVVDGDQPAQVDPPGLGVDLDHRHVGAEREGRPGRLTSAAPPASRPLGGCRRRGGHLGPRPRRRRACRPRGSGPRPCRARRRRGWPRAGRRPACGPGRRR